MHDVRTLRDDPAGFDRNLARRGLPPVAASVLAQDEAHRAALTTLQERQARRNALAKLIGQARRGGVDSTAMEAEAVALRPEIERLEQDSARLDAEIRATLAELPNRLDPAVPDGADENANLLVHERGMRRNFDFAPKQHFELGEALGMMDFERAAKLSGSRFVVLRGPLARLERALGQFMLDLHTQSHGYVEQAVPLLVGEAAMYGTDKLPKFADQSFVTTDGRWLIPTAEVPLTSLVAGEIVPHETLPMRLVALSPCFRSEAGAAGRDTRGMLRQHQFQKVELVSIVAPDASEAEHERMTGCAERVLELLEIPYRRMLLCAGDTGFGAARTYDLEAWLPGQRAWREVSSCSNTREFQARRMNARTRVEGGPPEMVHTLNGSALAVGRTLIAVMENGQQADGSILIPPTLQPYCGGMTRIGITG
ncbi:serine--tRNA ligase [Lichenicoccus sp.]|uniref:serine--tRNA ligase n=1 Tax=Lichenicoccus sp. TaxID=2781899 RepID=UPI003D0C12BD